MREEVNTCGGYSLTMQLLEGVNDNQRGADGGQ
jgi:hypothetical protein